MNYLFFSKPQFLLLYLGTTRIPVWEYSFSIKWNNAQNVPNMRHDRLWPSGCSSMFQEQMKLAPEDVICSSEDAHGCVWLSVISHLPVYRSKLNFSSTSHAGCLENITYMHRLSVNSRCKILIIIKTTFINVRNLNVNFKYYQIGRAHV